MALYTSSIFCLLSLFLSSSLCGGPQNNLSLPTLEPVTLMMEEEIPSFHLAMPYSSQKPIWASSLYDASKSFTLYCPYNHFFVEVVQCKFDSKAHSAQSVFEETKRHVEDAIGWNTKLETLQFDFSGEMITVLWEYEHRSHAVLNWVIFDRGHIVDISIRDEFYPLDNEERKKERHNVMEEIMKSLYIKRPSLSPSDLNWKLDE